MKLVSKMTLGAITAALIFAGCGGGESATATPVAETKEAKVTPSISEESLGLRKTDLYSEDNTIADKTAYHTEAPGTSKRFKRAYQDAPPMIPHDVADFLPITKNNNACTGCHMPEVAPAMGATPIPPSHFLDMRPHHKFDGKQFVKSADVMKNETDVKKLTHLSQARFNCSQCHAPQTTGTLAVNSTFEANYTREDGETKSSWDDVILDELDTVGPDSAVTATDLKNENSPAGYLEGGH